MALSSATLKSLMVSKIEAISDFPVSGSPVIIDDRVLQAISEAIVEHVTGNAVVIVTSVSGVTTGPGVSGPGAGTIT